MMCARSVTRSSSALQSRVLGITCVHSENGKLAVIHYAQTTLMSGHDPCRAAAYSPSHRKSIRIETPISPISYTDGDVRLRYWLARG